MHISSDAATGTALRRRILLIAVSIVMLPALAAGFTTEEFCRSQRAKATGKFLKCVHNQMEKPIKHGGLADEWIAKLSKCQIKYAEQLPKLSLKYPGTTCTAPRWVDNGLTVTDNLTGLIWEKKTDDGSVHDWANTYTWSTADGDSTDEDGTVFTTFLATLNAGGGFAGANGWRLPTFAELQTILLPDPYLCSTFPCIDAVFGPYTSSSFHWTSTSDRNELDNPYAWYIDFFDGALWSDYKTNAHVARAVRGGS